MNVRPKFYAWLKSEVEFHNATPYVSASEFTQLSDLLAQISSSVPELDTYYDNASVPHPNIPLREPSE